MRRERPFKAKTQRTGISYDIKGIFLPLKGILTRRIGWWPINPILPSFLPSVDRDGTKLEPRSNYKTKLETMKRNETKRTLLDTYLAYHAI